MTDTTNIPISSNEGSKDNELSLGSLTDQNWLFIKHYLETADIRKSYKLAGYTGTEESAPYQVFKRLKQYIEEVGNMAVTSRLKLVADLNKVLSIPLVERDSLTVSEWIRVRKLAMSLTPEVTQNSKLSVLVINRYPEKGHTNTQEVNNSTPLQTGKDVIDIEPIQ